MYKLKVRRVRVIVAAVAPVAPVWFGVKETLQPVASVSNATVPVDCVVRLSPQRAIVLGLKNRAYPRQ